MEQIAAFFETINFDEIMGAITGFLGTINLQEIVDTIIGFITGLIQGK